MESAIVNFLESIVLNLSWLNYVLIVIFGILESIPVFGFIIPGQTIMILYGFASSVGGLNPIICVISACVGAIIGDSLAYYIGKNHGPEFIKKFGKRLGASEGNLSVLKKFVSENTCKALILGRLNSFSRSLSPFCAGISEITFIRFFIISFIGSTLWASASIALGYIFGGSFEIVAKAIGKFMLIATIFALLLIYTFKKAKQYKQVISKEDMWLASINAFSIYIFAHFAETVRNFNLPSISDIRILEEISGLVSYKMTVLMIWISTISDKIYIVVFSTLIITLLGIWRKSKEAGMVFVTIFGGVFITFFLKVFFHRERPVFAMITEDGGSFPSGHSVFAGIIGFTVIYLANKYVKNKTRKITIIIFGLIYMVAVPFSRLYLGVHWPSDVIAGLMIGVWWVTAVHLLFQILPWVYRISKKTHIIEKL